MKLHAVTLALAVSAASVIGADADRYDAALFGIVVPEGRVSRAGPGAWWISAPGGHSSWSATRTGSGYIFTRPDRSVLIADPNGRGGWTLRERTSVVRTDARRDAAGGLTVRMTNGAARSASASGRVVRESDTSGWADVYDLDRGQYRPRR